MISRRRFIVGSVGLVASVVLGRRLLSAGGGSGAFTPGNLPSDFVGLFNADDASAGYNYKIGAITSADGGETWTPGAAALIAKGTSGSWDDGWVKDPSLIWDGSQFVCYYAGYDGAQYRIGRATAATVTGTWTKFSLNPVIDFGGVGDFDEDGAEFPIVLYEPSDAGAEYKMWYAAYPNGATAGDPTGMSIGYAYSSDGVLWTKHGQVLAGTGSGFEQNGTVPGAVIKLGSTYHMLYGGWDSTLKMHSAYATFTDPEGTYTRQGQISGYTGNISAGGYTWQSNMPRGVIARSGFYRILVGVWNPTPVADVEACVNVEASSLTDWDLPSGLMIALGGGTWYASSAENPSVIAAP